MSRETSVQYPGVSSVAPSGRVDSVGQVGKRVSEILPEGCSGRREKEACPDLSVREGCLAHHLRDG